MTLDKVQVVFETPMQVGECPLWHAEEAALYWIDIPGFAVHRLHPESNRHQSWALPSEPGCIAHCASGGLIVAMRSGLALLDTGNGACETVYVTDVQILHSGNKAWRRLVWFATAALLASILAWFWLPVRFRDV